MSSTGERLTSWKAIARHLGCSVRTARRWEAREGLPVHRQQHAARATVYAYAGELDAWRRRDEGVPQREAPPADAGTAAAAELSLVVLPFVFLGSQGSDAYLADGFTDEIIIALSALPKLRVISRTSSMSLKDRPLDARAIGRELGVQFLVEGSVRSDGRTLRVSAQLIDAVADDRLWSDRQTGKLDDVFALQDTLAQRILDSLPIDTAQRPIPPMHTSVVVWQCVLQARQLALRWREDALDLAIRTLENGIEELGEDIELLAALGRTWLQYREAGIDVSDRPVEAAEACAAKLAVLAPAAAPTRQLQGYVHFAKGDIQAAIRSLEAALAEESANLDTLSLLANSCLITDHPSAGRYVGRLVSIDPLTPLTRCLPGWTAALAGDFAGALDPYRVMFEMDPGNPMGRLFYVWMLVMNGDDLGAARIVDGFPVEALASPPAITARMLVDALEGRPLPAPDALEPAMEAVAHTTDIFSRLLADAYALQGRADAAVHWLSRALDRGFAHRAFLAERNPALARIADHPSFQALLERLDGGTLA